MHEMAAKKKTGQESKKKPSWTFNPPDDVRRDVELAMQALGSDRTELLVMCVKRELRAVVREILEERKKAAQKFVSDDPSEDGKEGKGK